MNCVIYQGYADYWGTSDLTASQIMEAYVICDKLGLIRPIVKQCQYNILYREPMENNYRDLFKKYKMGTTVWSPLNRKYIDGIPDDNRAKLKNDMSDSAFSSYIKNKKEIDEKLIKLKPIADKYGCNLVTLSIAWFIANPDVSVCF